MAIPLVSITGKVLLPNGTAVAGTIEASLSQAGSVLDGAVSQQVAALATGTIGSDGTVTLSLVPNDAITPSGTSYRVRLRFGSAVVYEIWQLASTPSPIDVGAVPRLDEIPGVAVGVAVGNGDVTNGLVTATGSTTARALKDIAADVVADDPARGATGGPSPMAAGARLARSIVLRAVLRSRGTYGGVAGVNPSGTGQYGALWLRDYYHLSRPFPGYFTAAVMRPVVDAFVATIGGEVANPSYPAERIGTTGTATYRPGTNWGYYPVFDSAAYLALLAVATHRAGDRAVFAAHRAKLETALGAAPRDGAGLLYVDPALLGNSRVTCGWGFEDSVQLSGGVGMATALHAWAYEELRLVAIEDGNAGAAVNYRKQRDDLISGLRTLRRSDGFYNAATGDQKPHAMLTALVVAKRLADGAEEAESAAALLREYRRGTITQRGAVRHLVAPSYFTTTTAGVNTYQNGGYWLGEWVAWLADSWVGIGARDAARQVLQEAVDEVLRQHRVDGQAPWEWQFLSTRASPMLYGANGAFLAGLEDASPAAMEVELAGANGSSAFVRVPSGHEIVGAEVVAIAASTVTVAISAAARTATLEDWIADGSLAFGGEATIVSVTLANAVTGSQRSRAVPAATYGGYIKVTVTSGSSTGTLRVRLLMAPATARILATAGAYDDDFATDRLPTRYWTTGTWNVSSGRLRSPTNSPDPRVAVLNVPNAEDVSVTVTGRSSNYAGAGGTWPGLALRVKDSSNFIFARCRASAFEIFEKVGGTATLLGTAVPNPVPSNDADITITLAVTGTAVTLTYGAQNINGTTTITGPGRAGVCAAGANATAEASFDNLTVTVAGHPSQPVPPGFVLEYGGITGLIGGDSYAAANGTVNLLDDVGTPVESRTTGTVSMGY